MSAESKIAMLKDRALFLQKARSFFFERGFLEVDTPILSKTAPIDEHIDIMSVDLGEGHKGYLHSSPEYAMKRLLCMGMPDIFQLGHVFRQNEVGALHNPEFTMAEWYRLGVSYKDFIAETIEFIRLFLGNLPWTTLTYKEAFLTFAGIDPFKASVSDLLLCTEKWGLEPPLSIRNEKDDLLHFLLGFVVEPNLGKDSLLILTDYPVSMAALAATEEKDGETVAKRFEIYHKGIELGNGYLELTDAEKQMERFIESNQKRIEGGKTSLPIDTLLIEALKTGMPPCCGVAVGFDRLLLLKNKASSLTETLPLAWAEL
jgi:lysyl-tRNA synthetase class 2